MKTTVRDALWYDIADHAVVGRGYVNGFTLWVGFGAALGLWRVARSAPMRQSVLLVNVGLLLLLASLIGARLFYTWVNRAYFSSHIFEVPQIWLGGLSWPGAIGGAWIAMLIFSIAYRGPRGTRVSFGWLADRLYPLLSLLCITTWLGCWMVGSAYGALAPTGAWWGVPSLDETGIYQLHWPLQPLAAVSLLVFFGLLDTQAARLKPVGWLSGVATAGLLVHLLFTSMLCADPGPVWNGQRVDTWMAAAYLAGFIFITSSMRISSLLWRKPVLSDSLHS